MALRNLAKAEKEYVRGIIHNLSLQRWTDQEIANFIHDEKQIKICRSSVAAIRSQVEKSAEKWYIELKQSRYKYIANYKERLDSLFSYQKRLNDIISTCKKPEVQVRAIGELVSTEKVIFDIWKQLPELRLEDKAKQEEPSIVDAEDLNGAEFQPWDTPSWLQCDGCKRWWKNQELLQYHKARSNNNCVIPKQEDKPPQPATSAEWY